MAENTENKLGLSDQIDELEGLVEKKSEQRRVSVIGDQVIPILDELVTSKEQMDFIKLDHENGDEYDAPRYNQLVEQVEEKLSHELDEIVSLLKGNLKDSILHELQDRIRKDSSDDEKV